MRAQTVIGLIAGIILIIWIISNPAQAGDDLHSIGASVLTFFRHIAGTHS